MSELTNPQQTSPSDDSKSRIGTLLDAAVQQALAEVQFDAFYQKTAAQLTAEDENCLPLITRRILRAGYKEKEILLQILKYFKGVAHTQFLQDLLSREVITARMGRIILDIFNKSDMILESGIASRLLDLDALSQQITHSVLAGTIADADVQRFIGRPAREQEGIMVQLIEEAGPKCAVFLAKLFESSKTAGQAMLKLAVAEPSAESYGLLTEVHEKTGNKEILKIAKKMAHSLKQKGVTVAADSSPEPQQAVFKTAELPEPRAFATMIDAEGFRLLFMFKPISQHEIKVFNIMLCQDKGIHDIEALTVLRRESKQLVKNILSDKKIEFIEIPVSHAAYLMTEAAAIAEQTTGIVSPVMTQWRALFSDFLPPAEQPAVYKFVQADDSLKPHTLELLDRTEIPYWFIATDAGRDLWLRLRQPDTSQTTDGQTVASEYAMADQFFTEKRLHAFAKRLEEQAYLFYLKGNAADARLALTAASDLTAPGLQPSENAFCYEIIRRGIQYYTSRISAAAGSAPSV